MREHTSYRWYRRNLTHATPNAQWQGIDKNPDVKVTYQDQESNANHYKPNGKKEVARRLKQIVANQLKVG